MNIAKNLFKKSGIGVIVFFLLNIMTVLIFFSGGGIQVLAVVFAIYIASIFAAFSPFGEWVLCFFAGAKKIKRIDMQKRIEPLFETVYRTAKMKTPGLADTIELRIVYTSDAKAYAIGRKTICITEGLMRLPDEIILGLLSHEIAHLAHRHTEIQLLIGGGNIFITVFILILRGIAVLIATGSVISAIRNRSWVKAAVGIVIGGIIWLWTKFCILFLSWSMRENEYAADAYAVQLGYGVQLAKALDATGRNSPQKSFLKALYSTHPNTHERIGRLQQMGIPYTYSIKA
ncbi:MAG: M48 family metalloprotease [Defluviitaleaceae bacterium]|nr:M48 family metalloprotease [Defluviitaleaceae bacterium]